MFKKVTNKKVFENILEQLRELMENGTLGPGNYLPPERELADQLGVGRSSLREALRVLEIMGIISNSPKRGTMIQSVNIEKALNTLSLMFFTSPSVTLQLFEVSKSVESEIAYYAALRRKERDLQRLNDSIITLSEATNQDDFAREDHNFHFIIVDACRNIVFGQMLHMISTLIYKQMLMTRQSIFMNDGADKIVEQHKAIYEAIKRQNPDDAKMAMLDHILFAEAEINKSLSNAFHLETNLKITQNGSD